MSTRAYCFKCEEIADVSSGRFARWISQAPHAVEIVVSFDCLHTSHVVTSTRQAAQLEVVFPHPGSRSDLVESA